MFAKFTFVRFEPPIDRFFICQTYSLRPVLKNEKSKPNRLCEQ